MTNPAVEALKPCPFCGDDNPVLFESGEAKSLSKPGYRVGAWMVRCDCGIQTIGEFTKDTVVQIWNRRAQAEQTPVAGRVVSEELCKKLELHLHGGSKDQYVPSLELKMLQELRAAPTVRKEES